MTWFKNLSIYKLEGFKVPALVLQDALTPHRFTPCGELQDKSTGFVCPRDPENGAGLVYELEGQYLMSICSEKKLLPSSVVRKEVERLAVEFEKKNGFKPGKKVRKELKEQAVDELLPKAFATRTYTRVWIDTRHGLLVIDTGSQSRADSIMSGMIRALNDQSIKVRMLRTVDEPAARMSEWIFDAPQGFTVDADGTVFSQRTDGRASVKYTHVTVDEDTARKNIEAGNRVTALALTYDDKISFTLNGAGAIKRIAPAAILTTKKKQLDDTEFASDFLLMTGELRLLIAEVCEALGGVKPYEPDLVDMAEAGGNDPDDHYPDPDEDEDEDAQYNEAVKVVRRENRASISLVQRHLHIGYNRAAHLLELMEQRDVVTAQDSKGNRTVRGLHAV